MGLAADEEVTFTVVDYYSPEAALLLDWLFLVATFPIKTTLLAGSLASDYFTVI